MTCSHTELPESGCAHCRGHRGPAPVIGPYQAYRLSRGRPVGLPEYVGQPYGLIRVVKIEAESRARCQFPGCARPAGDRFLCKQCLDNLGVALGDVPSLQEDLLIAISRQSRFNGLEGQSGTDDPLPYAEPAAGAWRALNAALAETVTTLCEHRRLPRPWGCSGAVAISRFLLVNLEAIATDTDAGALADRLVTAAATGRAVINSPADKVYLGLCLACQTAMHAEQDTLTYRCRVCGQEWDVAERLDVLLDKVRSRLVTTSELVKLQSVLGVKITLDQIKGYVFRKRLIPRGSRGGTALYSVGEFLDLLGAR